jgi:hypothetical protein
MWKLGRRRDEAADQAQARMKALVLAALGGDPGIGISVNEIICADPSCPGTETVILVMVPGKQTAACKVAKPMSDTTDDDIRDALRELSYGS